MTKVSFTVDWAFSYIERKLTLALLGHLYHYLFSDKIYLIILFTSSTSMFLLQKIWAAQIDYKVIWIILFWWYTLWYGKSVYALYVTLFQSIYSLKNGIRAFYYPSQLVRYLRQQQHVGHWEMFCVTFSKFEYLIHIKFSAAISIMYGFFAH